ncbi:hypothetical protein NW756_014004 [Fusarium oxysporum]|nr:hypothetical protein NW763_014280 [Fusarium oxysporum]KAJ4034521.1 hypothetical protein NW753_012403 [Fusarium oxysporum]KAJ4073913.1 hypothetical protein NW756_014004 [Fusarium oxysporum]
MPEGQIPRPTLNIKYQSSSLRVEDTLLSKIRDKLLFKLGAGTPDVENISIINNGVRDFPLMANGGKTVELRWFSSRETESGKLAASVAEDIRGIWPRNHIVEPTDQIIVEGDGKSPITQISLHSLLRMLSPDASKLILPSRGEDRALKVRFLYEALWQEWCTDAAATSKEQHADVSPLSAKFRGKIVYCTLSRIKKERRLFPLDKLAGVLSYDEPFHLPLEQWDRRTTKHTFDIGQLLSFLEDYFIPTEIWAFSDRSPSYVCWQIRHFCPQYHEWDPEQPDNGKCYLFGERQTGRVERKRVWKQGWLEEKRARVTLRFFSLFPGLFNIVALGDNDMLPGKKYWNNSGRGQNKTAAWDRYGLKPCGKGSPITHFLFEILRVFETAFKAWDKTLDSIDSLVEVDLRDFGDDKRVEELMFDKSFELSKEYFVALQILRIINEWIDEPIANMEKLRDSTALKQNIFGADQARNNFDATIRIMRQCRDKTRARIKKKSEEIESLRDGLFNATSLREATKAMELSQAVYAFTVVTVLFTPVSFLATFWALPFLNNTVDDKVTEPVSFRSSFIAMPLFTYALVIGIAWYMRLDKSSHIVPPLFAPMRDTSLKPLVSLWNGILFIQTRWDRRSRNWTDSEESSEESV